MVARSEPAGREPAAASADREIVSSRVFDAPRELVFEAFADPGQLARWWGPNGFTNTVREFDLRPGGVWRLTMHGPDGTDYENESVFVEVARPARIVFRHLEPIHRFLMTHEFDDLGSQTRLTWRMLFESAEECAKVRPFVVEANEQNFDRLAERLTAMASADREIVLTRVFDAPRERVFAAWTDPDRIGRWWGPRGFTTTTHSMDVRPGGEWRFVMHGPDGTDYKNRIVYVEVAPPERLVYEHAGEEDHEDVRFRTTVTFAERDGGTELTLRMVFDSAAERDRVVREYGAVEGGKQTLERLAEQLATEPGSRR